jgi:hypothetical protein
MAWASNPIRIGGIFLLTKKNIGRVSKMTTFWQSASYNDTVF